MIASLIGNLIQVYLFILIVRAVASWFPIRPGTPLSSAYRVLLDLTEPVLAPIRRVIPPAGMFDLSATVVIIVLLVLTFVPGRPRSCTVTAPAFVASSRFSIE